VGVGLSPAYVLDTMQWYEVDALLEGYDLRQKDSWEKVRTLAVSSLQANSNKRLKATKIFPLPWDKRTSEKKNGTVEKPSNDYINSFKTSALEFMGEENKEVINLNKLMVYGK